jgi:hypothetical protein
MITTITWVTVSRITFIRYAHYWSFMITTITWYGETTSDGNSSHGPLGRVRQVMTIVHMALWVGWKNKWWQ